MRWGSWIATLLLLPASLACDRNEAVLPTAAAPVTGAPAVDPLELEVETIRVAPGVIQAQVSVPGSIVARRVSPIGAEVRGRIEKVFVDEGDRVEAGDPLFEIDREPYAVALRQAEAGLELARSERQQIEADLARIEQLEKKAIASIGERDRMRTSLAVAVARQAQAKEAVALARHELEHTVVTAPFDGSISERLADEGTTALVQPQTIVVVLHETAELEAEGRIPESQLAVVQSGDPARVHVEGQTEPIETVVASVGDTIDEASRTYHVRMRVPNAEHRLKAGVFARIEILPRDRREALLVPRESIRSEAGHTRVLVVREGRAEAVPVQLGIASGDHAEVLSGIEPGTEVIVGASAREIAPGMRVRVVSRAARVTP